ncbi:MAG: helix-turn-helix domain-containing protein [Coprococcus sp.]
MKIIDSKSLGEAIRIRRKELKYTQAYIAEFTGFSVSFISDLERGKCYSRNRKGNYNYQFTGNGYSRRKERLEYEKFGGLDRDWWLADICRSYNWRKRRRC